MRKTCLENMLIGMVKSPFCETTLKAHLKGTIQKLLACVHVKKSYIL